MKSACSRLRFVTVSGDPINADLKGAGPSCMWPKKKKEPLAISDQTVKHFGWACRRPAPVGIMPEIGGTSTEEVGETIPLAASPRLARRCRTPQKFHHYQSGVESQHRVWSRMIFLDLAIGILTQLLSISHYMSALHRIRNGLWREALERVPHMSTASYKGK